MPRFVLSIFTEIYPASETVTDTVSRTLHCLYLGYIVQNVMFVICVLDDCSIPCNIKVT